MPAAGLVVNDVSWANELSLGALKLMEVTVEKANSAQNDASGPKFLASLGLDALKRLDIIVDGKKGFIYMQQKGAAVISPAHNRIGAVFTPETLDKDDLLAHVLEGSPAYEAGIRNGDILLAIDGTDVTNWRTNPAIMPMTRFWERVPGTKTSIRLKREEKEFQTSVVLRNLIGPDDSPSSQKSQRPTEN